MTDHPCSELVVWFVSGIDEEDGQVAKYVDKYVEHCLLSDGVEINAKLSNVYWLDVFCVFFVWRCHSCGDLFFVEEHPVWVEVAVERENVRAFFGVASVELAQYVLSGERRECTETCELVHVWVASELPRRWWRVWPWPFIGSNHQWGCAAPLAACVLMLDNVSD